MPSTKPKIVVEAPIPTPSVNSTEAARDGRRAMFRTATLTSGKRMAVVTAMPTPTQDGGNRGARLGLMTLSGTWRRDSGTPAR